MQLEDKYPAISDLRRQAKRRLPHFVWEFLEAGTGTETQRSVNRGGLDRIKFETQVLKGAPAPELGVDLLGHHYDLPFGVAPVGMSGLVWPKAEILLAQAARKANIPYCLSTVASRTPEDLAPHIGASGWFQLYPPKDPAIRRDMIERARDAGFHTLVLTVDLPAPSRRERQRRAGLTVPPRLSPGMALQCALHPNWSLSMLRDGIPRLRTVEKYVTERKSAPSTEHSGYAIRTSPDWTYLKELRAEWHGPLVVKGVTGARDARALVKAGADAIWVSNHGGRQFDGGPPSIELLPPIRAAVGDKTPILFDSGVEGGIDVLRAMALGADFVMLGRGFHYALAALGATGPHHLTAILQADLIANMGQLGIARPTESAHLVRPMT